MVYKSDSLIALDCASQSQADTCMVTEVQLDFADL